MSLDELIIYQYGRIEYDLTKIKDDLTEYKDSKQNVEKEGNN